MNAKSAAVLSAKHVSVLHDDFKAVNDVSITLRAGEWIALVGPNGAGKSSLLKALAGLTLPSGEVARKKVDFSSPAGHPANTKAAIKPAMKPSQVPRVPITAAAQQEAKLKREKMMDEFHGRVAGIKHNVDALNNRLSDFEEKVHKEDANLVKGNPEDFRVDLD